MKRSVEPIHVSILASSLEREPCQRAIHTQALALSYAVGILKCMCDGHCRGARSRDSTMLPEDICEWI